MTPQGRISVLLVDDNPAKLTSLAVILDGLDLDLVMVTSGKEALRHCLNQEFAAILLDVNMPEMDGFETAALIRQRPTSEHTPILFVTAYAAGETQVARGYSLGAVDYILSPIVPEILRAKVAVFVDLFNKTEQVKRQAKLLEAANKELEAFSYSVSHNLRAPLRSIDGFSLALLEEYGDKVDEQGRRYLERVRAGAQRMGELIDDMLTLSRTTRGDMSLEEMDLSAMAGEIVADLKRAEPGRKVEFVAAGDLRATADRRLIRVVLENLLGNAFKFTAKHETARIEFGRTETGGTSAYFIRDNGAGFDMAFADRLFGVFQRLHSEDEFSGTGIGLASVQRIVHRHGGRVWAEGQVEKGATFYFTLQPVERAEVAGADTGEAAGEHCAEERGEAA